MESYEIDLMNEEQRQEQDRQYYNDCLDELRQTIENCLSQANIDNLEIDDIRKTLIEAFNEVNPEDQDRIKGWV